MKRIFLVTTVFLAFTTFQAQSVQQCAQQLYYDLV